MTETPGGKPYDLEERTYEFSKHVRAFVKKLPQMRSKFKITKDKSQTNSNIQ